MKQQITRSFDEEESVREFTVRYIHCETDNQAYANLTSQVTNALRAQGILDLQPYLSVRNLFPSRINLKTTVTIVQFL